MGSNSVSAESSKNIASENALIQELNGMEWNKKTPYSTTSELLLKKI